MGEERELKEDGRLITHFCAAETQKISKRTKKLKSNFGGTSYDPMVSPQKKQVAIDDAQCVAFKLNKTSDFQV